MKSNRSFVVVAIVIVAAAGFLIYANQSRTLGSQTIDLTVTNADSMSPSEPRANLDYNVTINIGCDTTGDVRLRGYEIDFHCTAGQTTSRTFKADTTGQFQFEWVATGAPLGFLVVS
jgi:hypothetical protein